MTCTVKIHFHSDYCYSDCLPPSPQVCVTGADGGIKRVQIAGAAGSAGGAGGAAGTAGQQKVQVAVSGAALHPVTAIQVCLQVVEGASIRELY